MKRYFLKTQNSLQGQIIAGSLVATFAFGTVGSGFAGAMEENLEIINIKDDSEKNQGKKDEEIFLEEFKFNDDNMAFIKEIKENYEKWEGLVFGDEMIVLMIFGKMRREMHQVFLKLLHMNIITVIFILFLIVVLHLKKEKLIILKKLILKRTNLTRFKMIIFARIYSIIKRFFGVLL